MKRIIESLANLFLKKRKGLVTPMDSFFSIMNNLVRIFIVVILPLGIFAGVLGAFLRKKFEGTKYENIVVTGSMLIISIGGLFALFIYFNYFR